MKSPKCRTCGKEHALGGCPEFQSTAARIGRAGSEAVDTVRSGKGSFRRKPIGLESLNDGTVSGRATASEYQASPVDTQIDEWTSSIIQKHNERLVYQAKYQRDLRAATKLGISVKEFRAAKVKEE